MFGSYDDDQSITVLSPAFETCSITVGTSKEPVKRQLSRLAWYLEDVDLGMRLRAGSRRIRLDPAIQGQHPKRWTLANMIYTDSTGDAYRRWNTSPSDR